MSSNGNPGNGAPAADNGAAEYGSAETRPTTGSVRRPKTGGLAKGEAAPGVAKTDPIMIADNVTRRFGGLTAVDVDHLEIPRGAITALIGPNGAGKTTLFNTITGAYRADAGEVLLKGVDVTQWQSYRIVREGIARTFQNIRLFGSMTVWEHLLVAQPHSESAWRRLLPISWANPAAQERAEEVMEFFGLTELRDRPAKSLPYGIQSKVEMARAVTARPKLLLLDEPVAGMNHDEAEEIRALMIRLRDTGLTILLIEHDMNFVMRLFDYLYVLDFGVLIAEGRAEDVRANPVVLDAYLGKDD